MQPNGWGIDYPCLLSPYENVYHEVMFRSDMPELFQLLGESNLTVEIPSVENGHLQMNGKQVRYTSKSANITFFQYGTDRSLYSHLIRPSVSLSDRVLLV